MSQFETPRNLLLVEEEYIPIKENDLPDPVIFLTRCLVGST